MNSMQLCEKIHTKKNGNNINSNRITIHKPWWLHGPVFFLFVKQQQQEKARRFLISSSFYVWCYGCVAGKQKRIEKKKKTEQKAELNWNILLFLFIFSPFLNSVCQTSEIYPHIFFSDQLNVHEDDHQEMKCIKRKVMHRHNANRLVRLFKYAPKEF